MSEHYKPLQTGEWITYCVDETITIELVEKWLMSYWRTGDNVTYFNSVDKLEDDVTYKSINFKWFISFSISGCRPDMIRVGGIFRSVNELKRFLKLREI